MGHDRREASRIRDTSPHKTYSSATISAEYFEAPICILSASLRADDLRLSAAQDLTQGYSIFTDRIRNFLNSVDLAKAETHPSIQYLRSHAHTISACIVRDINRVTGHISFDSGGPNGSLRPAFKDERHYPAGFSGTKLYPDVSHHALQLLSCILGIPVFCSVFSDEDLRSMLGSVVHVLRDRKLSTYNAPKTRVLAMWVLSTQRLPEEVLSGHKGDLMGVIRTVLCEESVNEQLLGDCLKTLHDLLTRHPALFFAQAAELVDIVLPLLTSPNRVHRLRAAYALAGLAHAVVWSHGSPSSDEDIDAVRTHICERVLKFAKLQGVRSKQPSTQSPTLRDLLTAAVPASSTAPCGPDTPWAFSLLSSLIALTEGYLFTSPPLLRMVFQCLPKARTHDLISIRSLHSFVWRCLIWAFARTPQMKEYPASDDRTETAEQNFRHKVFSTVRQDGRTGVRSCLVHALLSMDPSPSDPDSTVSVEDQGIRDSLLVLQDLVQSSHKTLFTEGLSLLKQLTSAIGSPPREERPLPDLLMILPLTLLDGSLVDAQPQNLHMVTRKMTDFDTNAVRSLTEVEVNAHWEPLVRLWESSIKRAINDGMELTLQGDLCTTWQALLLAKTQLTQSLGHLTATPEFTKRTIAIVKDIITSATTDTPSFVLCLKSARQLWRVMKLVFSELWLSEASDELLMATLSVNSENDPAEIHEELENFTVDLLLSCSPDLLATLDDATCNDNQQRRLWSLSARQWSAAEPMRSWHDTAVFLSVPLRCWAISSSEQDIWAELLGKAMESAYASDKSPDEVLDALFKQYLPHPIPAELIPLFIDYLTLDQQHVPTITLKVLKDFLLADTTQGTYPVLCIFNALSLRIKSCPSSVVLPVLRALGDGLSVWISVEKGTFSEEDYTNNITKFYCSATQRLAEDIESPQDVLSALENFLFSPFETCRSPPCVYALKDLCEALWLKTDNFDELFPPRMKAHLAAWYDVVGGARPSFVPDESQSQWQSQSQEGVVPPLQPEDIVETSFADETPLPPFEEDEDNTVGPAHVTGAAETKELGSTQRHVFGDALRINHREADKDKDIHKSKPLPFDSCPPLPPLYLGNLRSKTVLGKRSAMPEQEPDFERKRHRTMFEDTENRDIHSSSTPSVHRSDSVAEVATSELLAVRTLDVAALLNADSAEVSLPSPPCTAEAVSIRSQSFEIAYEGPDLGLKQTESAHSESQDDASTTPDSARASSVDSDFKANADPRTTGSTNRSASLHMIREALEALKAEKDMPVEEVLSAQEALQEMGSVLVAQLARRLKRTERSCLGVV